MTLVKTIFSILLVLSSLGLSGCGEQEPIKIGFLGSISGRSSELCLSAREGAQLAIERVNEQGGINGRLTELILFDHANEKEMVRKGVHVLADSGVVAIIGPTTSQMAFDATPEANARKIVLISPTVSTVDLSGLNDFFFRVYPTSEGNARTLANYAVTVAKNKRIAILANESNTSFTEAWKNAFTKYAHEFGSEITTTIIFNSTNKKSSFLDLAEEIVATRPDGILILTNSIDAGIFSQQVRKMTSEIDLYGSDWTFSGELVQYGGKGVEGFTFTTNVDMEDSSQQFKDYKMAFIKRFDKEPNFPSVFAYEATQLLFEALRIEADPVKIPEALNSLGVVNGLQGTYKLDRYGDIERPPFLNQVKEGRFVRIETP